MKPLFELKRSETKRLINSRFVTTALILRRDEINIRATTKNDGSITSDNAQ